MAADHDMFESLVAAYVLGACDADDVEAARSHIERCPECRELARRLSSAAGALPMAAGEVPAPAGLRQRILAAAAAGPPRGAAPGAARKVLPLPSQKRAEAPPRRSWRPGWLPSSGYAAAVAALAIGLVGLGAWNVSLQTQLNQKPALYRLLGSGSLAGAQGSVTSLSREGITFATFQDLPQAPAGKVYQVWLIPAGGAPESAGVFTPDVNGNYTLVVNRSLQGVRTMAVTVERGPDGVGAPTEQPQLAGAIA